MPLAEYMVDYSSRKIPARFGPLDDKGIPLFEPQRVRRSGPPIYHPTVIIQYALAHHELALKGNLESALIFAQCAQWVEDNAVEEPKKRFLAWYLPFPLRSPPVKAPWLSGMTQGQALSVLSRLYQKTGSPRTAEVARRAAQSFLYSVSKGGVVCEADSGAVFIEEVASAPTIHILNGCLYGLFGVHEYVSAFDDPKLQAVLERCLNGVEELLPAYDIGWWSRYSLGIRSHMASFSYHHTHVRQLRCLAKLFNRPLFDYYAERWEGFHQSHALHVRRRVLGFFELNFNRFLTIAKLNPIKYRRIQGLRD